MQLTLKPSAPNYAYEAPGDAEHLLSFELLQEQFQLLLPQASVSVLYEWYPNTSDVLIASSSFGTVAELNDWSLKLIAVNDGDVVHVRELLLTRGLTNLADWFTRSDHLLQEDPAMWLSFSLTIRYERGELLFDERKSHRNWPRPEAGWSEGHYIPHKKAT
jgi:hypothetical protein